MMRLQRAGSAESSSTESKNKSKVRVRLSLSPPKSYQCSLCSRSFRSVQALGGHQNAHRKEKNAMHKMYMDILRSLKQEEEPLVHSPMPMPIPPLPHHQLMPPTVTVEPEIDLELGLSCGPSSPKLKYYEFMPMKG